MNKKKCITIVPIYRRPIDIYERNSFETTCSKFRDKVIDALCIVTFEGMEMSEYEQIASSCGVSYEVRYFPKEYFQGIHGYNLLMLDPIFYHQFEDYEYMLICQLDAMIIGNDLHKWTDVGYDYIGGPIMLPGYSQALEYATVGNGGFSLRRISAMLKVLGEDGPMPLSAFFRIKRPDNPKFTTRKKILYSLMAFASGRSSRFRGLLSYWVMEDMYLSYALQGTIWQLSVPSPIEASHFAFDLEPDFWYNANGGSIPFGAHKYGDYHDSFYRDILLQTLCDKSR